MALENNQIDNSNTDNDEISLKELVLSLKSWIIFIFSKWKVLIAAGIIGGLIGMSFSYFDKTKYKAVLSFAMEDDKGGGGGGGLSGALGLASSFGIDLGGSGGGAFAASNLAELMKSRLIVEKVLLTPIQIEGKTITLVEFYLKINNLRLGWDKNSKLQNLQFLPSDDRSQYTFQQDSILHQIHKILISSDKLKIEQKDKKVSILYIEVVSENELFSKIFCENLAKETSNFYVETKSKKARMNLDVLRKQVDSVRNELNKSINGVAKESDNVYNLNPSLNIKAASSKKNQVNVQANTAILTNLVVQMELAEVNLRKETPLIQLIDTPALPLEKQKLGKLKSLLIGGFIFGFITLLYLILGQVFKKILL